MHRQSKWGITVLAALGLSLVGSLPSMPVHAAGTIGSSNPVTVTRVGTFDPRTATVAGTSAMTQGTMAHATAKRDYGVRVPHQKFGAPGRGASAPGASESNPHSKLSSVFNGLSNVDNKRLTTYDVEPPDQAMAASPRQVVQLVNIVAAIYSTNGKLLAGPFTDNQFFGDLTPGTDGTGANQPYQSDPRIYYDPQTRLFVAEIWETDFSGESHIDIAVNATGDALNPWTLYRIDSTTFSANGCPCLPDYTMIGADANGVYLTSDNFRLSDLNYAGGSLLAIRKADLLAGSAQAYGVLYRDVINDDQQAFVLQPATSPFGSGYDAGTEYAIDAFGAYSGQSDNRLGVWALANTAALNSTGVPVLSEATVAGEPYSQPPNALQRDSTNTLQTDGSFIYQPVQNVNGVLWAALTTGVTTGNDTTVRAGVAWYNVAPQMAGSAIADATIPAQGYVGEAYHDLYYPALAVCRRERVFPRDSVLGGYFEAKTRVAGAFLPFHSTINEVDKLLSDRLLAVAPNGLPAMGLSYSGPKSYPSLAVATGLTFDKLAVIVKGRAPYAGQSCASPFGCRWGDYNAASVAPTTGTLWFAGESVIDPQSAPGIANWGTGIFSLVP